MRRISRRYQLLKLYSVCDKWKTEQEALVELYLDGKMEVLGEKSLYNCHFVLHKSHMDWSGPSQYSPLTI